MRRVLLALLLGLTADLAAALSITTPVRRAPRCRPISDVFSVVGFCLGPLSYMAPLRVYLRYLTLSSDPPDSLCADRAPAEPSGRTVPMQALDPHLDQDSGPLHPQHRRFGHRAHLDKSKHRCRRQAHRRSLRVFCGVDSRRAGREERDGLGERWGGECGGDVAQSDRTGEWGLLGEWIGRSGMRHGRCKATDDHEGVDSRRVLVHRTLVVCIFSSSQEVG
jgi:hypothetical protein